MATQAMRRHALSRALAVDSDVVVDLSALTFADTSLVVDLALIARRLRRKGRCLWLRDAQPQVWRIIDVVGLNRLPGVALLGSAPVVA